MTKQTEAMKLALEALLWANDEINGWMDDAYGYEPEDQPVIMSVITALREALAEQPAQVDCCANCLRPKREHRGEACPKPYTTVWHAWDYDFPPDQPAQQEPVCDKDPQGCWSVRCQLGKQCKNTPAQRTWVGLTDEEVTKMPAWIYSPDQDGMTAEEGLKAFARAIEAKLKEKNT